MKQVTLESYVPSVILTIGLGTPNKKLAEKHLLKGVLHTLSLTIHRQKEATR